MLFATQIMQIIPGVQAGIVTIRKNQFDRVGADRFYRLDFDILLADL